MHQKLSYDNKLLLKIVYLISLILLQENLNLVETLGVYVKVRAGLDILTKQVTWELLTIDPETGKFHFTVSLQCLFSTYSIVTYASINFKFATLFS